MFEGVGPHRAWSLGVPDEGPHHLGEGADVALRNAILLGGVRDGMLQFDLRLNANVLKFLGGILTPIVRVESSDGVLWPRQVWVLKWWAMAGRIS